MNKLPAIQFYPGDWRKDPAVQALSFHDRGVWFEIICLMHESERRGALVLSGRPMSDEAIARNLGLTVGALRKTITTLLVTGVASRDDTGALICRRMVKDERLRQTRIACGRLGGNPNLVRNLDNQNSNQNSNQTPTPSSSSSTSSSEPPSSLSFDHDMVATAVMAETGTGGMKLRVLISDIAKNAIAAGEKGEQVRDLIVGQWDKYRGSMPRLAWTYGSLEKFLEGGLWRDVTRWPWKEGTGPPKAAKPHDPLAEINAQRTKAQEERDRTGNSQ